MNGKKFGLSKCPDTSYYKGKNQKKRTGKRKAARKRRNPSSTGTHDRAWQGARPCASHHRPWWTPWLAHGELCPSRSVRFFNPAFCALLVLRFGPRVLPMLGHFEPPLQASLIHMASQDSFFLQLLGSSHVNLQSKLKKAETSVIGEIEA